MKVSLKDKLALCGMAFLVSAPIVILVSMIPMMIVTGVVCAIWR